MADNSNFIEELMWRRMIQDKMPGTEELLNSGITKGYIGFDPTADSLGVGNMVQVMLLKHFQAAGHKPIALVGGATGLVGDPSGKSAERNLLDEDKLNFNLEKQKRQLEKFLDFNSGDNSAEIVNNYDWFKNYGFLAFIRDIGKHITINYMMAKDSVKSRLETGMSFTEFSYQLVQGYDFYYLWKNKGVMLQMGGSDQWGNIVTGTELIRRMDGGEAFALTTPLIKKADGTKFGKTESGNIWLDPEKTSPYEFYQFWLKVADADIGNFIRIFSMKTREEIEALESEQQKAPGVMQRALAEEVTERVHDSLALSQAKSASEALFRNSMEDLLALDERIFNQVMQTLEPEEIDAGLLKSEVPIIDILAVHTTISKSKGEARRAIEQGSIRLNKEKVTDANLKVSNTHLIKDKAYLLIQNGKNKYHAVRVKQNG
jgi:tyrosyl-tRNA synthetase